MFVAGVPPHFALFAPPPLTGGQNFAVALGNSSRYSSPLNLVKVRAEYKPPAYGRCYLGQIKTTLFWADFVWDRRPFSRYGCSRLKLHSSARHTEHGTTRGVVDDGHPRERSARRVESIGEKIVIQYHNSLWWEPCPAPLPPQTPDDRDATPKEGEQSKESLAPQQQPPPMPPLEYPGDEYEWLIML